MRGKQYVVVKSALFLVLLTCGCVASEDRTIDDLGDTSTNSDTEGDAGADADSDADTDADSDADTDNQYTGPAIPETCAQADLATTTVGCLFYAADLDGYDDSETQQYAVAVSNVNQTDSAAVEVYQGSTTGWSLVGAETVAAMDLHVFNLPDYHLESSGLMVGGAYKIVSDVPIIAYQFAPLDGANSYTSDASLLIPVPSLSERYDIIGWRQTQHGKAYFAVVAVSDGTEVTITPTVVPAAGGGVVPSSTTPFTVEMNDGDVLEVATKNGESMTGSQVVTNQGHPVAVFSAHECANIPANVSACDHLEEQMPGLVFWGKEFVAARMPVRSNTPKTEVVLWQLYASENETEIVITASPEVEGLPATPAQLSKGELLEFYVSGTKANPGDFYVEADKPIGIMQYMISANTPKCDGSGDPAMVYLSPVEQFLSRYVVLVPTTWQNDMLIITRKEGVEVILDGVSIADSEFVPIAGSGYEVARHPTFDGNHSLESDDGIAVIVVGWDEYDSYAYAGGMGLAEINPVVK